MYEKLKILTDAAKYDVACTSSGVSRQKGGMIGNADIAGICHSWAADGRCISLLKVLFTNFCEYDCAFCINRKSNDVPRTAFTPEELADLTMEFYRRNYIEGLFVSSGVVRNPDYTMELIIKCVKILRYQYRFNGYIHAKIIPGASNTLIEVLGRMADRVSINIELPSEKSLSRLAPQKSRAGILSPMKAIAYSSEVHSQEVMLYQHAQRFAPAGRSTQMIVGASDDTDFQILRLTQALYDRYKLKRVFYSAYVPVNNSKLLPRIGTKPPLAREHRLYQADWLIRYYGFRAEEMLTESENMFNLFIDPKCSWAINNMHLFPCEVNTAPYEMLVRVPGIGIKSAQRIIRARKIASLDFDSVKKLGVVLKRAQFFITCRGKSRYYGAIDGEKAYKMLAEEEKVTQLSLFGVDDLVQNEVG